MAEPIENNDDQSMEEDVWNSIPEHEATLEETPNDQEALYALSDAYSQIGDHTKAKEYVLRLATIAVDNQSGALAVKIIDKLKSYAEDDPAINDIMLQVDLLGQLGAVEESSEPTATEKSALELKAEAATFSLASEMTFAWKLMESGDLTQDEYAGVINDLTEMSSQADGLTISLLHVLESRNMGDPGTYMGGLVEKCGTPIISLDSFEATTDTALALPINFVIMRGAIVFDYAGTEALVVLLNPYDPDVREETKEFLGGKTCHFFVTQASQFDRRVSRITEILKDREEAAE